MPVRPRLPASKTPWPMKWIALAIVVFIVPYTWLTLRYRKPEPAYEPAAEAERRAAEAAKWQKLDARFELVADGADAPPATGPAAIILNAPARLPEGLRDALGSVPALPAEITAVDALPGNAAGVACVINFTCALAAADTRLIGAAVFGEGGQLVVLPLTAPMPDGTRARSADVAARVTLPVGALKPGRYTVTIAASSRAKQWTLEVK
jgi:hypothetical protein